ncbi:MAG: hypothetical protein AAB334_00100 [Patescibacteria group bacterium]
MLNFFESGKGNSLRVAVNSLINYNSNILSVSFGNGRVEVVVEKIPPRFKGKIITKQDKIKNYIVYYGVNNNILIIF